MNTLNMILKEKACPNLKLCLKSSYPPCGGCASSGSAVASISYIYPHRRNMPFAERKIVEYEGYFSEFLSSIGESETKKIFYVLDMLKIQERVSEKFVKYLRDGLYELRVEYNGNIYRVFFCFDEERIVILFNGFQKKSQKTPNSQIEKVLNLKREYYESKKSTPNKR
jgi:phage-related protein